VKSFGDQPTVEDRGGRRIHRWTFRRERAFEAKDLVSYLVSLRERRATVQVTTFESWTALGDAVLALWKDRAAVTPAVRQKAQELTATATTEAE
jgi:hypothetical protein